MSMSDELNNALARMWDSYGREHDGEARQQLWQSKSGWIVGYTTSRIVGGGEFDGAFATLVYKPNRRKDPTSWTLVRKQRAATRRLARERAVRIYRQHNH